MKCIPLLRRTVSKASVLLKSSCFSISDHDSRVCQRHLKSLLPSSHHLSISIYSAMLVRQAILALVCRKWWQWSEFQWWNRRSEPFASCMLRYLCCTGLTPVIFSVFCPVDMLQADDRRLARLLLDDGGSGSDSPIPESPDRIGPPEADVQRLRD